MCRLSPNIKLCTCETDLESVNHYWTLYRSIKGKYPILVGEFFPPAAIDPADEQFNAALLNNLLNKGNLFDENLVILEKDRLLICVTIGPAEGDRIYYSFLFTKDKWISQPYDPFDFDLPYKEKKQGTVERALD